MVPNFVIIAAKSYKAKFKIYSINTNTKYLLSIVGPTAIGKTSLSIELAKYFNTEIVSADSRQFFKELKIGTAVPSDVELNSVKHHFIQHKSIKHNYSVGTFEKDAIKLFDQLFKNHNCIILVGGSGLYIEAITKGLDDFPEVDSYVRDELNTSLKTNGLKYLQNKLKELDPKSYTSIAIDNPQRVIRALEVCIGSGKPYSSFLNKKSTKRNFKTISVGLSAERDIIYNRINDRVDIMIKNGLLKEVKSLLPFKDLNALNTVGYKELFNYIEGKWELDFAISEIKKNTRRFAKRQLTWFNKKEDIFWFNYDEKSTNIIKKIEQEMK